MTVKMPISRLKLLLAAAVAVAAVLVAVTALALTEPMATFRPPTQALNAPGPLNVPAAQAPAAPSARADHDSCNTTSWTWPLCEIRRPSVPRFDVQGPRPDLTPKESAWCRNDYIKASTSGYVYWKLTQNTKYDLTFWPDYYSRYYQAIYWDGRQWAWVVPDSRYPGVILGQRVNCDA